MKRRTKKRILLAAILFFALVLGIFFSTVGCMVLTPLPAKSSVPQRLDVFPTRNLPIRAPATVYWDEHMIPFIEAQNDKDLAFVLGMVHAHLRLGQMEMFKRVAQGRLAEMFGPPMAKIDHSLRILNLGKAAKEIHEKMPAETRTWLEEFVRGVNYYRESLVELPHEFKITPFGDEAWTAEDVITIERLVGVDVTWLSWVSLLSIRDKPYFDEVFEKLREEGGSSVPSFDANVTEPSAFLSNLLACCSKSGSNSFAVSRAHSATGGALLANDPHLGIMFPSTWLIVGCKSPSTHTVGVMFPGVPFTAMGRNPHIAWGGTNMRAQSSDLYDASQLPSTSREESIRVRWWLDRTATIRETEMGPIITDIPFLRDADGSPVALRWMGHEPSDEFTALLRANRATNWQEFRKAFAGYAVSGMNVLYADVEGNIGHVLAVALPKRDAKTFSQFILDPNESADQWQHILTPLDLPYAFNPAKGILVSCNNLPVRMNPPVGVFFPPSDRLLRITDLLQAAGNVSLDDIKQIQQDTYSAPDIELRDLLLEKLDEKGLTDDLKKKHSTFLTDISEWDGYYKTDSSGAAAFQTLLWALVTEFASEGNDKTHRRFLQRGEGRGKLIKQALENDSAGTAEQLKTAFAKADEIHQKYKTWGEMHRFRVEHVFDRIPLTGSKYRFGDYPAPGSNQTVHKAAHSLMNKVAATQYGSNARHISDLSDPDENYFVLIGGQDGWLNSAASLDQISLWREGKYIKVPLQLTAVKKTFKFSQNLTPSQGQ